MVQHNEKFWNELEDPNRRSREFRIFWGRILPNQKGILRYWKGSREGSAKDITLSYNSNGSIYPEHAPFGKSLKTYKCSLA